MNNPQNWTNGSGVPYTVFPTVTELYFNTDEVVQPELTGDMTVDRINLVTNAGVSYHFTGEGFTLTLNRGVTVGPALFGGTGATPNHATFDVDIHLSAIGEVSFSATYGSFTFNNPITGSSVTDLTLGGGPTYYLNAANSYSGTTTLSASATISFGHHQGLSTGNVNVNGSSPAKLVASTDLTGANKVANNFTLNGDLTFTPGSDLEFGGTMVLAGSVRTLTNSNSTGVVTLSGVISGEESLTIRSVSNTTLRLTSGANTFAGNLAVRGGGRVEFNSGASLGAGSAIEFTSGSTPTTLAYLGAGEVITKNIALPGSGTGGATFDQSGTGLLKFTSDFSNPGNGLETGNTRKTITLQGSTDGIGELAGSIGDALTGLSSQRQAYIVKKGTGTWILSGANTNTGTNTVEAGTLLVHGSLLGGGATAVQSGGRLGGGGTIAGNATIQTDGALAAGGATGSLTFNNNLTFQTDARFELQTEGVINVAGALNLGTNNWTLALIGDGTTFQAGGEMVIFNYGSIAGSSSLTPTFDLSQLSGLSITPGDLALFKDTENSRIILQGIQSIPEPSGIALVLCGGALAFWHLRRRR